jgi:hypothetical protein
MVIFADNLASAYVDYFSKRRKWRIKFDHIYKDYKDQEDDFCDSRLKSW